MKKKVNIKKLLEYGFTKENDIYKYKDTLIEDKFKIIIYYDNTLNYQLIDLVTNEEYVLVKVKDVMGEYVGYLRDLINAKLNDIINKCFDNEIFKCKQTKEIINYLQNTYDVSPEFLWEDDKNAALRHPDTLKWFGIIMTITKDKLGFKEKDEIEIIDLKMEPDKITNLVDNQKYFLGYHMNKKHWLTIILNESISTQEIINYLNDSYNISNTN